MNRIVTAAGVLLFVVAGCTSTATEGTDTSAASTIAAPTTAPPTTTTAPSTTTTTPQPTTAADGIDLEACADATCEIAVSRPTSIPVPSSSGVASFEVRSVDEGTVTVSVVFPVSGGGTFACQGDNRCSTHGTFSSPSSPGSTQSTGHVGATFIANQLSTTVVAISDGSAVLRLQPA